MTQDPAPSAQDPGTLNPPEQSETELEEPRWELLRVLRVAASRLRWGLRLLLVGASILVLAQVASVYERRGDFDQALAEVEGALAVRDSRDLRLYGATLRAKVGDLDGAVREVERMLEDTPGDDELLFNLGVLYGEAKQSEEAIDYMQQALASNPDNASALNYIGYTWAEQGENLDEAERMISRAIELRPDDGYIVDSLGWVYYMRARPLVESGRPREARRYLDRAVQELQRAVELTGGDPVISEHLGDAYLLMDDKQRALEKFEEAVAQEPRDGEQPTLLEKLDTLQKELR